MVGPSRRAEQTTGVAFGFHRCDTSSPEVTYERRELGKTSAPARTRSPSTRALAQAAKGHLLGQESVATTAPHAPTMRTAGCGAVSPWLGRRADSAWLSASWPQWQVNLQDLVVAQDRQALRRLVSAGAKSASVISKTSSRQASFTPRPTVQPSNLCSVSVWLYGSELTLPRNRQCPPIQACRVGRSNNGSGGTPWVWRFRRWCVRPPRLAAAATPSSSGGIRVLLLRRGVGRRSPGRCVEDG
jgi:hypothetical protein